jgi:hypothetical protein
MTKKQMSREERIAELEKLSKLKFNEKPTTDNAYENGKIYGWSDTSRKALVIIKELEEENIKLKEDKII